MSPRQRSFSTLKNPLYVRSSKKEFKLSDDFSQIQERRLLSLRLLIGAASHHIAPTSEQLREKIVESGVYISQSAFSNLLTRKAAVKAPLARSIESALNIRDCWMDADHAPYLGAAASDIELLNLALALPREAKDALLAFLHALPTSDHRNQTI